MSRLLRRRVTGGDDECEERRGRGSLHDGRQDGDVWRCVGDVEERDGEGGGWPREVWDRTSDVEELHRCDKASALTSCALDRAPKGESSAAALFTHGHASSLDEDEDAAAASKQQNDFSRFRLLLPGSTLLTTRINLGATCYKLDSNLLRCPGIATTTSRPDSPSRHPPSRFAPRAALTHPSAHTLFVFASSSGTTHFASAHWSDAVTRVPHPRRDVHAKIAPFFSPTPDLGAHVSSTSDFCESSWGR
ncbi:hypothetical protein K438DRAFT_99384 [Mycena galopus ATCC 62051]|nr:hypothetical protein K438DRAFT_99384 [Mycena galopus ATCC 62051]